MYDSITIKDSAYPKPLTKIHNAPIKLFYRGNLEVLNGNLIAFVGTRNSSPYGKFAAEKLIEEISLCNVVIVSGLAYGIDTISHEAAMKNGLKTIAVLGNSIDEIYPPENKELADRIVGDGGLILSEYAPGLGMQKFFFPERNRIIAGLSVATVVVEAPSKSGALLTSEIALVEGRSTFAVPADIDRRNSAGCNNLIRNSEAQAAMSGGDIIRELQIQPSLFGHNRRRKLKIKNGAGDDTNSDSGETGSSDALESAIGPDENVMKVFKCIHKTKPVNVDEIAHATKLHLTDVNKILSLLEIHMFIVSLSDGSYLRN